MKPLSREAVPLVTKLTRAFAAVGKMVSGHACGCDLQAAPEPTPRFHHRIDMFNELFVLVAILLWLIAERWT